LPPSRPGQAGRDGPTVNVATTAAHTAGSRGSAHGPHSCSPQVGTETAGRWTPPALHGWARRGGEEDNPASCAGMDGGDHPRARGGRQDDTCEGARGRSPCIIPRSMPTKTMRTFYPVGGQGQKKARRLPWNPERPRADGFIRHGGNFSFPDTGFWARGTGPRCGVTRIGREDRVRASLGPWPSSMMDSWAPPAEGDPEACGERAPEYDPPRRGPQASLGGAKNVEAGRKVARQA